MGETFSRISAGKMAKWRLEQASIVLEEIFLMQDELIKTVDPFMLVLLYTADVNESNDVDALGEIRTLVTGEKKDAARLEASCIDTRNQLEVVKEYIGMVRDDLKTFKNHQEDHLAAMKDDLANVKIDQESIKSKLDAILSALARH